LTPILETQPVLRTDQAPSSPSPPPSRAEGLPSSPPLPPPAEGKGAPLSFADLGLASKFCETLEAKGYETPTPVQAAAVPLLLSGRDLVVQARTGTGKTAAFALPLLQGLEKGAEGVQALVLVPTRELAIQVTGSFEAYAGRGNRVSVLTVYGGVPIQRQIRRLHRGVQIVIGTPGRLMDCMKRGALRIDGVRTVVLDEADEMLRMGFLEDVEWILGRTPERRQTALFSATIPEGIRRIAKSRLRDPEHLVLGSGGTRAAEGIDQRYLVLPHRKKFEALSRILEAEAGNAVLVFARTKAGCDELVAKLGSRGLKASALHGDLKQAGREEVVRLLKAGRIEVVVATDVAARGLDIDGIGLVINFDPPADPEVYVHRIGRTGRAGREGRSLLLLTPRERHILRGITRFTEGEMTEAVLPTRAEILARRAGEIARLGRKALENGGLEPYRELCSRMVGDGEADLLSLAAAFAKLASGGRNLHTVEVESPDAFRDSPDTRKVILSLAIGREAGMRPGTLVGAITNEAGVPARAIGAIDIRSRMTRFTLEERYVERTIACLARTEIRGRPAILRRSEGGPPPRKITRRPNRLRG